MDGCSEIITVVMSNNTDNASQKISGQLCVFSKSMKPVLFFESEDITSAVQAPHGCSDQWGPDPQEPFDCLNKNICKHFVNKKRAARNSQPLLSFLLDSDCDMIGIKYGSWSHLEERMTDLCLVLLFRNWKSFTSWSTCSRTRMKSIWYQRVRSSHIWRLMI